MHPVGGRSRHPAGRHPPFEGTADRHAYGVGKTGPVGRRRGPEQRSLRSDLDPAGAHPRRVSGLRPIRLPEHRPRPPSLHAQPSQTPSQTPRTPQSPAGGREPAAAAPSGCDEERAAARRTDIERPHGRLSPSGDAQAESLGHAGVFRSVVLANRPAVAAGRSHSLGLKSDGTIVPWGYTGAAPSTWTMLGVCAPSPCIPSGVDGGEVDGVLGVRAKPNPFAGSVSLRVAGPNATAAQVLIFDAAGRLVRTAWSGVLNGRAFTVTWDGRDDSGREAATGIYMVRLESGSGNAIGRLVKLR